MNSLDSVCHQLPGMVPTAVQVRSRVVEQVRLAHDTYRVRVECPALARQVTPGQFFMIRAASSTDPLLGRPFALYDTVLDASGAPVGIEFVYHVIGKATRLMSQWEPGEAVELWGPLGNGFPQFEGRHLVCVGGGIGYTPFLAVARETAGQRAYGKRASSDGRRVTLCYGSRSRDYRADLGDFDGIPGFQVEISTDDGSEGHKGFVTDLLLRHLVLKDADGVYCCGPEPMMKAVARICASHDVPCWLSLETPMACGFGACFSCVTRVRIDEEPGWDYRRTCVEGPVFPAMSLVLD
jgi:dihydroorotate dehydrogenase electron transfer subunit